MNNLYQQRISLEENELVLGYLRKRFLDTNTEFLKASVFLGDQDFAENLLKELYFIREQGLKIKEKLASVTRIPTLREISNLDEDGLIADLSLLVLRVDKSLNVGKDLNPSQILLIAESIAQHHSNLTLEDIALCFNKGILAEYGEIYDRLDVNVIVGWVRKYSNERSELHALRMQNAHRRSKDGMSYDPIDASSVNRVMQDRGIDPGEDARYNEFKQQLNSKKIAIEKRIERKKEKSQSQKSLS